MDKTSCKRCGAEILSATAENNGGLCMPCYKGKNKRFEAESDPRFLSLVAQFRSLNCADPESHARLEITENIPELSRINFLRELWQTLTPRGVPKALKSCGAIIEGHPFGPPVDGDGPYERLLASNADMNDVVEIARHAQISVLVAVVSLLDGVSTNGPVCEDASWGLYEQFDDGKAGRRLDSLHELVLDDELISSLEGDND
jgi:hypothetical protein